MALGASLLAARLAGLGRLAARAVMVITVVATLFGSPLSIGLARQVGGTTVD